MFDRCARMLLFNKARKGEPAYMICYCFHISPYRFGDVYHTHVGMPRNQKQDLNAPVIGYAFKISLKIPRSFLFSLCHTYILSCS